MKVYPTKTFLGYVYTGPVPNSSGFHFSKAPETFRARKAIFSYLYIKNSEVYKAETLYEGNPCSY